MLEIMLISWLSKKLAANAEAKGQSKWWGGLAAGFWLLGELGGFVIGAMLGMELAAYGLALVCAGVGAGIAFAIVNSLGDRDPYQLAADEVGATGHYDPSNPYSPPGTYNA
jgi:hypothetical protein